MRARHRHFNPRFAGADLVLDSRYINQADNTAVTSWADRSANAFNADQTTPANQPTFQTNEVASNGVVRFDGSNDFLTCGDNLDILTRSVTMIGVAKFASTAEGCICGKAAAIGAAGRYSIHRTGSSFRALWNDVGTFPTDKASDTSTSWRINTQTVERNVANTLFWDGAQQAQQTGLSGTTSYDTIFPFFVGAYQSPNSTGTPPIIPINGDIAQVVVMFSFNTPLRRRLEHAAAYSFKIACS
ncbi:MAG: hypothetical protein KGR46_07740 [Verrucomicrobia bacterium]|nr:hypothetical protein [Verrucomicrobiota bacterium]